MNIVLTNNETLGIQTVNGRELQDALEMRNNHTNWAHDQIDRGAFKENVDYVVSREKPKNLEGGRPITTYHFTLHAAKHIAMMSRSKKGKGVRDYFIRCEERLLGATPPAKTLNDWDRTVLATKAAVEILMLIPGVKHDVLGAHTMKLLQNASGVDLQELRLALPGRATVDIPMNVTALAERCGVPSAREMNLILAESGLQFRQEGKWTPTKKGEQYCDNVPYQNPQNGHAGWQLMWRSAVLDELVHAHD